MPLFGPARRQPITDTIGCPHYNACACTKGLEGAVKLEPIKSALWKMRLPCQKGALDSTLGRQKVGKAIVFALAVVEVLAAALRQASVTTGKDTRQHSLNTVDCKAIIQKLYLPVTIAP